MEQASSLLLREAREHVECAKHWAGLLKQYPDLKYTRPTPMNVDTWGDPPRTLEQLESAQLIQAAFQPKGTKSARVRVEEPN